MGTEIPHKTHKHFYNPVPLVKLNNPLMGTEINH